MTVFTTFFVLVSISHACQAKPTTSAFALAIASYTSLHPALLLPPVGMLCYDQICQLHLRPSRSQANGQASTKVTMDQSSYPSAFSFGVRLVSAFVASLTVLLLLSRALLPSWQFIPSVYLTPLQLPDLTPNSGLWWYFFTEMFDAFRSFFLGVFWLHMLSYSVPLCLKFHKQPLAAVVLMMGVIAVFQPYANAGDAGAWLSALCLLSHTFDSKSLKLPAILFKLLITRKSLQNIATHFLRSPHWCTALCWDLSSTISGSMQARETRISSMLSR